MLVSMDMKATDLAARWCDAGRSVKLLIRAFLASWQPPKAARKAQHLPADISAGGFGPSTVKSLCWRSNCYAGAAAPAAIVPPIVAGGTVAVSATTAAAAAGCTDTPIARVESVARLPLAAAAAALSMSPPVVSRWRYRARATAAGPAASSVNGTSRESAPPPRQYDGVDTSEP